MRAPIEEFFGTFLAKGNLVDIQSVSANWCKVSWIFGFDVGMTSLGVSQNCASSARYLLMGEVEVILIDMKALRTGDSSMRELKSFLAGDDITAEALKERCVVCRLPP